MAMMTIAEISTPMVVKSTPQQVVVVSKQSHLNGLLKTVFDASHYDVVLVESTNHAYSRIKLLAPQLIIVCLDIDDTDGFQVLSMLKLDNETRGIRLVTCTVDGSDDETPDEILEEPGDVFIESPAMNMN